MYTEDFVERFWLKVDRRGDDECWPWMASCAGKGYGQIKLPGTRKNTYAHRVAYELAHGPLGKHQACHRCDNPACCNPKHLFSGTSHDNHMDMQVKGRSTKGKPCGKSKLDEKKIRLIFDLRASGFSQAMIAKAVDVHQVHVGRILNGKRRSKPISSEQKPCTTI